MLADIVAVTGKTEGPGGPDDDSRTAIDSAIRGLLHETGVRSDGEIAAVPMNFSGGSGGVISPHFTVFLSAEPDDAELAAAEPRLRLGRSVSRRLRPDELGRMPMVTAIDEAVRDALRDGGLSADQAMYAMVKNPMLTPRLIEEAAREGLDLIHPPTGMSALFKQSGGAALGAAQALGDLVATSEQIGTDPALYSARVSASSGAESDRAQTVVFGNAPGVPGHLSAGYAAMRDALDVSALHRACRAAGLDVADFADPATFAHRVAAMFVKCNPTDDATLRGYPQVQRGGGLDTSYTTQLKASVGGMFAAALGNPAFYISGAGIHQGAPGGGSVVVIVDHRA